MSVKSLIGKVCSVLTVQLNRSFSERQWMDYFVGYLESVDESGVTIRHPVTGKKSFFSPNHIVGIVEEDILDPADPEEAKIIDEVRKSYNNESVQQPSPKAEYRDEKVGNSPFVDIGTMSELAKRAKNNMKK